MSRRARGDAALAHERQCALFDGAALATPAPVAPPVYWSRVPVVREAQLLSRELVRCADPQRKRELRERMIASLVAGTSANTTRGTH